MKKIIVIFLAVVLLLPLLVVGCGIAQEQYDAVVAERDTLLAEHDSLQNEVSSMQRELDKAQDQIDDLEGDVATAESQVESLKGQVSTTEEKYNTLKQKIDKAMPYGEYIDRWYFVPAYDVPEALIAEWSVTVAEWDDANVKTKWEVFEDSRSQDDYVIFILTVWEAFWEGIH